MRSEYQALKTELLKSDLAGLADAAAATKLNTDPGNSVADTVTFPQLVNALSVASQAKVFAWNNFGVLKADMAAGDVQSMLKWADILGPTVLNLVTSAEVTTMKNRLNQTKSTLTRAQSIPGWARSVTTADVTIARAG